MSKIFVHIETWHSCIIYEISWFNYNIKTSLKCQSKLDTCILFMKFYDSIIISKLHKNVNPNLLEMKREFWWNVLYWYLKLKDMNTIVEGLQIEVNFAKVSTIFKCFVILHYDNQTCENLPTKYLSYASNKMSTSKTTTFATLSSCYYH